MNASIPALPPRVLFLGIPSDPVDLARWTHLRASIAVAGIEATSSSLELGVADCAIVTEDLLDGICTSAEAAALQALRERGVTCLCASEEPARIIAAIRSVHTLARLTPESVGARPKDRTAHVS